MANLIGSTGKANVAGVLGANTNASANAGVGVHGRSAATGVFGESTTWHGVVGFSGSTTGGVGVYGRNTAGGTGVIGESATWMGVYGKSTSTAGGAGVMGEGDPGPGVIGKSSKWVGVYGETAGTENGPAGVWGEHKGGGIGVKAVSKDGMGLAAYSESYEAIHAETRSSATAAVAAYQLNPDSGSAALYAKHAGNRTAAVFEGNVVVTGDVLLSNADCAEEFDVRADAQVQPGMVLVFGDCGRLEPCARPCDRRVAGVVSGAGAYRPALILDKRDGASHRHPIALLGKAYCLVDATQAPVVVGDLLTTSATPGHAMKLLDLEHAVGCVIGKAMAGLDAGRGLIPILVGLR